MKSKGLLLFVVACLVALLLSMTAVSQEAMQQPVNLSEGRTWGLGMQVGFPYGGLISLRSWFTPVLGVEGIVFLSGGAYSLEGTVTARGLFRASDADLTDFCVIAGATLPLQSHTLVLSVMGSFEFGFRLAPMLAWNIEFGGSYSLDGRYNMTIGTGLHYYFPGKSETELDI